MRIETIAVHSGRKTDEATKSVTPPIYLSTTFEREKDGSYPKGFNYSRSNNPNREALEKCLTELEGGTETAAFSSGSAAAMSILQTLEPESHIIAPDDMYHGNRRLMKIFKRWNINTSFVDMTNLNEIEKAINKNTKLIWTETPSNPLLKVCDLKSIAALAKQAKAFTVCDNTWPTPILQRPFDFGIDLILHATTKYIGGHSDVLGGAVISKSANNIFQKTREIQQTGGAVPSPFECWLVLRGIQTLPLRINYQSNSAMKIAEFLSVQKNVSSVHYPGLKSHPGYAITKEQMKLFGGMLSFQVKGGKDEVMKVAANVKIFTRATSLGGPESLIEHRASVEGPDTKTPDNLLRLSIGLENPDDLIEDLEQTLNF
jgi:cystathionine gamma-synthase